MTTDARALQAEVERLKARMKKLNAIVKAAKAVTRFESDGGSRLILEADLTRLIFALAALESAHD